MNELKSKLIFSLILFGLFSTISAQVHERPVLTKLPFAFSGKNEMLMENTPVIFQSRLLLVANYRPGEMYAKGENAFLFIDDLTTGQEVARSGLRCSMERRKRFLKVISPKE